MSSPPREVVLAYSGGLDTTVAIAWIHERYGAEVTALTIDVGQEGELEGALARARTNGARDARLVDAKSTFVEEFLWPAVRANALYQDVYPLSTALARPLIARTLAEIARSTGAKAVAHGCTGKGNDQVRFDVAIRTLAPELEIIAPVREWNMNRDDEIDYARSHGLTLKVTKESPYSVDENLWGRSIEGGRLEDPDLEAPEEIYEWTGHPSSWPSAAEHLEVGFEAGVPVAVDGKRLPPVELVREMNRRAGRHGVGRIDHVEDRVIGIKSRESYECPGAIALLEAHRALESLVLPRDLLQFKATVDRRFSDLVYEGFWFSPLRVALQSFVDATQAAVEGTVTLRLHQGSVRSVGRRSERSLLAPELSTFGRGSTFQQGLATGFIQLYGLANERAYRASGPGAAAAPSSAAPKGTRRAEGPVRPSA